VQIYIHRSLPIFKIAVLNCFTIIIGACVDNQNVDASKVLGSLFNHAANRFCTGYVCFYRQSLPAYRGYFIYGLLDFRNGSRCADNMGSGLRIRKSNRSSDAAPCPGNDRNLTR